MSYNGGRGGIEARPTSEQLAAMRGTHIGPTADQTRQRELAANDRDLRASVNHGAPPIAATARPGEFQGRGVVAANDRGANARTPAVAENRPGAVTAARPAATREAAAGRQATATRQASAERANHAMASNRAIEGQRAANAQGAHRTTEARNAQRTNAMSSQHRVQMAQTRSRQTAAHERSASYRASTSHTAYSAPRQTAMGTRRVGLPVAGWRKPGLPVVGRSPRADSVPKASSSP